MKNIQFLIFLGFCISPLFSGCKKNTTDASDSVSYFRFYGRTGNDIVNSSALANDGSIFHCGHTAAPTNGDWDVFVLKTDAHGNALWFTTIPGDRQDDFLAIASTPDGGAVAVGNTLSFGTPDTVTDAKADLWTVKFDATGNIQWQNVIGGGRLKGYGYENGTCVNVDEAGYIYVGGSSTSDSVEDFPNYSETVLKLKFSPEGNLLWRKANGTNAFREIAKSILITHAGNLLYLSSKWPLTVAATPNLIEIQENSDSQLVGKKTIGNIHPLHFDAGKIFISNSGSYLFCGNVLNDSLSSTQIYQHPYILKTDENFNVLSEWYYEHDSKYPDIPVADITKCSNGDLLFLMNKREIRGKELPSTILLLRVKDDGEKVFSREYALPANTLGRTILELPNGNLFMTTAMSRSNINDRDIGFLRLTPMGDFVNQ